MGDNSGERAAPSDGVPGPSMRGWGVAASWAPVKQHRKGGLAPTAPPVQLSEIGTKRRQATILSRHQATTLRRPEITTFEALKRAELRRQAVRDLPTAVTAADGLVDYKKADFHDAERGKNSGKNHKGEERNKKNDRKNGNDDAKDNRQSQGVDDKGVENNEGNDGVQGRVNSIRLVAPRTEKSVEGDGLMYVKALVNGKEVMAMVHTGATNSFIGMQCGEDLGLKLESSSNQIKMG
ncbi:hypothetical protein AgCh_034007 [Apium graveolens]